MRMPRPEAVTKMLVGAAICVSSVPAAAAPACVAGVQGCVLPLRDAVAAPVAPEAPAPVQVVEPVLVEEAKSFPWLLVLLGVAAAAVLAYGLLTDNDTNAVPLSP